MTGYAAFLRGINVGGHTVVPMETLKRVFEALQFSNVRTVLASGNVLFQAPTMPLTTLERRIEKRVENHFGKKIGVLVRSVDRLRKLAASEPFKNVKASPETRLYVTFLPQRPKTLRTPRTLPEGFQILRVTSGEVFSALTLAPGNRTVDLMQLLEKEFGHGITTRNYNTVLRVVGSRGLPGPTV